MREILPVLEVILIISIIKCSDLDYSYERDDNSQENGIDSESNEIHNISLKEKPNRVKYRVIMNNTKNNDAGFKRAQGNISPPSAPFDVCNDQESVKEVLSKDLCRNTLINYPFSVSIQKKGAHYATGALVGKRWILSVAGEFYNVRETIRLFRARLGSVDCKNGGALVPLKGIEIHPSYVYGTPSFDLALLRMAMSVDFTDFIRPIRWSNIRANVLSAKFLTTYWPRLIVKGDVLPEKAKERMKFNSMRVSTQRLIPWEKCFKLMQIRSSTLDQSSLCLQPVVSHHTSCMPDAGAPVVAEDGLWGITSGWVSVHCAINPSPTVFTRISSPLVRSWLDSQIINA